MFSGKAYARAVCGHKLAALSILSLLLEDFLVSLTESQDAKLIETYESNNPDDHINDDVTITLIDWSEMRKEELSLQSRTAAFWLKYTEYLEIVQKFIKAEQTKANIKPFHSDCT